MSLINQMLRDLEDRRGGARLSADLVLQDLSPTASASLPRRVPGISMLGLLALVTLAVLVIRLIGMVPPTAAPPVRSDAGSTRPAQPMDGSRVAGAAPAAVVTAPAGATGAMAVAAAPAPAPVGETADPVVAAEAMIAASADAFESQQPAAELPATLAIRPAAGGAAAPDASPYARALQLARQGRHAGAIALLEPYLDAHGDDVRARLLLVSALTATGRNDELKVALAAATARLPSEPRLALPFARILVDEGRLEAAVEVLARAAPELAADPAYHAFTAALEQRLGRHQRAVELYRAVLAVRPGHGIWSMGLGISLTARGERDAARAAFEQALADPSLAPNLRRFVGNRIEALSGGHG
ncbi:MAG: tetratricopeptide repeat protein [Gammaproteobacteria bacterium]|nr:tetratricopeptide repeat protein [Gammaproteobacteria bacterium]